MQCCKINSRSFSSGRLRLWAKSAEVQSAEVQENQIASSKAIGLKDFDTRVRMVHEARLQS